MKSLLFLVLVFGFAHGTSPSEELLSALPAGLIRDVKDIMTSLNSNDESMTTLRKIDKVIKIKDIVDTIVQPIADLALKLVGYANEILAFVGIVLLIIYLIDGGDIKALVGERRALDNWDFNVDVNTINNVFEMVNQAMAKYDL